MAEQHFLRFALHNETEDLIFEVRKGDSERLEHILKSATFDEDNPTPFYFHSLDGRAVVINLRQVQAVRFLWEPVAAPSDMVVNEDLILIKLRGRAETLDVFSEDWDQVFLAFYDLEMGVRAYPSFLDEDGELLTISARELVWMSAPAHLVEEGRLKVEAES